MVLLSNQVVKMVSLKWRSPSQGHSMISSMTCAHIFGSKFWLRTSGVAENPRVGVFRVGARGKARNTSGFQSEHRTAG